MVKVTAKRSKLLVGIATVLAIGVASCSPEGMNSANAEAADDAVVTKAAVGDTPNVLFIAIDDLRPDLGVYGHPVAQTPNIDAFAKTGLVFDNAFVSFAVCGPSRAALMTGLRPDTTGIDTLKEPVSETAPNAVTMSQMFKGAGYESIGIGKIYHHSDDDMQGWTKRVEDAIGDFRQAERRAKVPNLSNKRLPREVMPDTINVRQAQKELQRLGKSKDPFFMAVGIHRPHLPFNSPESDWDRYANAQIPGPINPEGQQGAPDYALVSYEVWNYEDTPDGTKGMPKAKADELRKAYLAAVSYADGLVGDLIAELKAQNLEDDTIVVIWSDHGWKIADHNAWAKHSTANIDIKIPLIVRVPGMKSSGMRSKALVETVDIYPTLAALTGLKAPSNVEGDSFVPLLNDAGRNWKDAAFSQYGRNIPKQGRATGYTTRTERFRYTAWKLEKTGERVNEELYDLERDPDESRNVANEPEYSEAIRILRGIDQSGWKGVRSRLSGS